MNFLKFFNLSTLSDFTIIAFDILRSSFSAFLEVDITKIRHKQILILKKMIHNTLNESYRNVNIGDPEKRIKAEQMIINLTLKHEDVLPKIDNTSSIQFSIKSLLVDRRHLSIFLIVNTVAIFYNNHRYYYHLESIASSVFFILFQLFCYRLYLYKKLKNIILSDSNLYDFVWKNYSSTIDLERDFRYATGLVYKDDEVAAINTDRYNDDNSTTGVEDAENESNSHYNNKWRDFFTRFYTKHEFIPPLITKNTDTMLHIFNIPTLSAEDFISKQVQIQNFIRKRIYKVHRDFNNNIGSIAIEFEISELHKMISYSEVPSSFGETEIVIGKSITKWVTWCIETAPNALVVGIPGGGKSRAMHFLISQVIGHKWLPYFVDFKGGTEFGIYRDKEYKVITERAEFAEFVGSLNKEVEYRSQLNTKYRTNNIISLNKRLTETGHKPLPRIVIFLDEYADINRIKDDLSSDINSNFGRVLAKGRAAGVNLVVGTQRPDASTIGSGAFRDCITCRISGKMSESGYKMAFGVDNLSREDKNIISKMPNDSSFKGMFILQGTGTIEEKELVRVPFMHVEQYNDIVLYQWNDNYYKDYILNGNFSTTTIGHVKNENKTISPIDYM